MAVKVLPEEVAGDAQRLAFFEREARAVAALNRPNILTVHDVGTHDGVPYVVTELLVRREEMATDAPTPSRSAAAGPAILRRTLPRVRPARCG